MNIKNQIRLSVVISLILAAVISASIVVTYQHVQDLQQQESLAADVVKGGYELTYLTNDYIVNAEPRARVQWEERYASLQPVISQLKPGNGEEARSIESIRDYNEKIAVVFREIPDLQTPGTGSTWITPVYQQVIWSRNNVQSQGLIYEAWSLRHLYNNDVNEARDWNNILVLSLMVTMLVIIIVNYLLISHRLVRSIQEVNIGSEMFATGNLNYRIPITSDDEIGGIARRLNAMAGQLITVTASRDELNREIEVRKRAEEEIKVLNATLEQRVHDRTQELERATETIRASLDEKVLLLREIHHRVKNNLQILMSLLNLQSRTINDPQIKEALKESTQRIRAMSMVHEKLYSGSDLARIDFISYLSSLAKSQVAFYQIEPGKVTLETTGETIMLDINTAIPLGLVMNELLSNALKHAFPGNRKGTIHIDTRKKDGRLEISLADDGVGLPEGFDYTTSSSLGLRLVHILIEQLSGTIELDRTTGTKFNIVVKEKE